MSSRKSRLFFLILILVLSSSLIDIPYVNAYWLVGWNYRKALTITGSSVGAKTDYQIGIKVYYGAGADGTEIIGDIRFGKVYLDSKSMVDFGDVIFTNSSGTDLLDFWIEEKVNSNYAIIWVEVDVIPIDPNTVIIYIYYGKAAETTTSDGDNTFPLLFDEFNSLDPGTWGWTSGVSVAGGIVTIAVSNKYIKSDDSFAFDSEIALRSRVAMDSGLKRWNQGFAEIWPGADDQAILHNSGEINAYLKNVVATGDIYICDYAGNVYVKNEQRLIEVSDELEVLWGNNVGSAIDAARYPDENMHVGFQTWGSSDDPLTVDWCLLRKFVDPEPLPTSWGSEEARVFVSDPDLLFGAGFNASSPYVELHWNHSLIGLDFFEIQNSSDGISWDYLGQSTTANYTDTEVINGTERFYRVRGCNLTSGLWSNSSFTEWNFETVYFIASANGGAVIEEIIESDAPWIALAIILSIIAGLLFVRVKR